MFIAHAPAGYLLLKTLLPGGSKPSLWLTGLLFAVAPDLDLIWFYTLGARAVPHHQYITHWPLFWVALFGLAFLLSYLIRKPFWRPYLAIGLMCVLLHLVLDSVAAEIYWLAPFSRFHLNLVTVPAVHGWWVWNYVLHWSFALEVLICASAVLIFLRSHLSSRG